MIAEKNIPPFTPWKKALPLLVADPRLHGSARCEVFACLLISFVALPTDAERKTAYNGFMRSAVTQRGKQNTAERKAQKKAAEVQYLTCT